MDGWADARTSGSRRVGGAMHVPFSNFAYSICAATVYPTIENSSIRVLQTIIDEIVHLRNKI